MSDALKIFKFFLLIVSRVYRKEDRFNEENFLVGFKLNQSFRRVFNKFSVEITKPLHTLCINFSFAGSLVSP